MVENLSELKSSMSKAVANAKRESEINNQLEILEKSVGELRNNIETMELSLKPVLTPELPLDKADNESSDRKENSQLAMKIESIRDNVNSLNIWTKRLIDNLEV